MSRLALVILFIIYVSLFNTYSQETEYPAEDITVTMNVEGYGSFDIDARYSPEEKLFIPVETFFGYLRVACTVSNNGDIIKGFTGRGNDNYVINGIKKQLLFAGQEYDISGKLSENLGTLYLETSVFGDVFGIEANFSFRSLAVAVKADFELPVIKEKRLAQSRSAISNSRFEREADKVIDRDYHYFSPGTVDWSVSSTQQTGYQNRVQAGLGLGAELFGGEADIFLNYSDQYGFDSRMQNYQWRWVDNDIKAIRQVQAGRINPTTISSLYYPVTGVLVSNTPTTPRRSSGEFLITDHTEPDWLVELYINNVLTDYTRADASGLFTFKVPMVYGFSYITLRFYGPMGEERTETKTINIPYTFLPAGEFEYRAGAGILEDGNASAFGKAETAFGITPNLTLEAGFEYMGTIDSTPAIPFIKGYYRPFPKLIASGEYDHGVRFKGVLDYYIFSGSPVTIEYTRYRKGQRAILYNYMEELKGSISMPYKIKGVAGYSKIGYKRNAYENFSYNIADIQLSAYYKLLSLNWSTYANWISDRSLYVNSMLSLSYRLKNGLTIRPSAQFNLTQGKPIFYKAEIEKRFARSGYLSVSYENNRASNFNSFNLTFKYDLSFAQLSASSRITNSGVITYEGARGSMIFNHETGKFISSEQSNVGRAGITIFGFLDLNFNGIYDSGERKVENLRVHINGGRIRYMDKDTLIAITGLEPFAAYFIEISDSELENIAWQLQYKTIEAVADPNQLKILEIPVVPIGEVSGMVYSGTSENDSGLGRIKVSILGENGEFITETISESDGYWTWMGLVPGKYTVMIDTTQLSRIGMVSDPGFINFSIDPLEDGDIKYGLDFILVSKTDSVVSDKQTFPVPSKTIEEIDSLVKDSVPGDTVFKSSPVDDKAHETDNEKESFAPEENMVNELYYVQVGAFRDLVKARQYSDKLTKEYGQALSLVKEEGLTRVRMGYFRSRESAEALLSDVSKKLTGSFIGKGKPYILAGNLDINAGPFFIQTGAFRSETNARAYLHKVMGLIRYPSGIIIEDGLYKVRTGYFPSKEEALKSYREIVSKGIISFRGGDDR